MRTEIYSVRSSVEEVSYINKNLKAIVSKLNKRLGVKILYKTEIDCSAKKIKTDLLESIEAENTPELHVFINALDSKDSSSFCSLFMPLITALENKIRRADPPEYKKSELYPHVKVYPLTELSGEYPAYCFAIKQRKILVLPRISLVGTDLCDYLCEAIAAAQDVLFKAFDECPNGYIYSNKKPLTLIGRLFASHKNADPSQEEVPSSEEIPVTEEIPQATTADLFTAEVEDFTILPDPSVTVEPQEDISGEIPAENASEAPDAEPEDDIIEMEAAEEIHAEAPTPEEPADKESSPTSPEEKTEDDNSSEEKAEEDSSAEEKSEEEDSPEEKEPEKKGSKVKSFFKSFIPMKGDSVKSVILKIIVLIAIIVFLTGAFLLLKFYVIDPKINQNSMSDIQNIFYSSTQTITDPEGNIIATADEAQRNWDGLKEINDEIVGWIKIDNTIIDYPVLFHKEDNADSQFYLYKNYKKQYSDFGSIFMDYRCEEGADSKHVILHGHNMGSDDSMFGSLINYSLKDGWTKGNPDYYKANPIVSFDTPEENADWVIFAVMKIDVSNDNKTVFNYLQTNFESEAQFMNFVYNIKERSYLNIDIPINEDDRLLTLSTCSYETDNMRTVVVARKIRSNEDVSQYISTAEQATAKKTVSSDFATEFAAGNVAWYDGKGKLDGDGNLDFMEQSEMFLVTFVDANNDTIASQYVLKGEDATEPTGPNPVKEQDDSYYYVFKKWTPSFKNVTENLIIKPVYDKITKITEPTTTSQQDRVETPAQTNAPPTTAATDPAENTTATPATSPAEETTAAPDPTEGTTPLAEETQAQ